MLAIPGVEVNSLEAGGIRFLRTQVCNFQIKISNCHKYNNNKSLGNKRESRIVKIDKKSLLEKILTSTAEQPPHLVASAPGLPILMAPATARNKKKCLHKIVLI